MCKARAVEQLTADVTVAVLGAGTMGVGIAEVAARAHHAVRLLDTRLGAAQAGIDVIGRRLARDVSAGRLEAGQAREVIALLRPTDEIADLADCGIVVEAI